MYFRTTQKQSDEQYQQQSDDNSHNRTFQIKDNTRNNTCFKKTCFQTLNKLNSEYMKQ